MDIKRFEFTPILGWSVSRYDLFESCKKWYYYQYYGKNDLAAAKIEVLKKLTSIPLEAGSIVHDLNKELLKRLVKSTNPIEIEKFYKYARQTTESYCNKKQFIEVYYHQKEKINVDEIFEKVYVCLKNFLDSDRFKWIKEKAIVNRNNWIIEPPGFGEARIDGMKVYCKVDFLFPINDEMYIVDWKTGKSDGDKHRKQLMGYTVWASCHFNKSPEQIIPVIAYLQPDYRENEVRFNEQNIRDFSLQIKKETEDMYSLCSDIENNLPKEKMAFFKTANDSVCSFCNYREVCEEDLDF